MQNRFQKILVPTDFSEPSEIALRHAAFWAAEGEAEITLLHVRTIFHDNPGLLDDLVKEAEQNLKAKARSLMSREIAVNTVVLRDISPVEGIENFLADNAFDLIVMGTHGHGAVMHFVLGSVTESIVRSATCPVISVRTEEQVPDSLARILVGFDFSEHSKAAVGQAIQVAKQTGAQMHAVFVFEQEVHPAYYPIWEQTVSDMLPQIEDEADRELRPVFEGAGLSNWRVSVIRGNYKAPKELAEYARTTDADLIVVGTHGLKGWDRWLLGSTSERLLRIAPCPVMTVHLPGAAKK